MAQEVDLGRVTQVEGMRPARDESAHFLTVRELGRMIFAIGTLGAAFGILIAGVVGGLAVSDALALAAPLTGFAGIAAAFYFKGAGPDD